LTERKLTLNEKGQATTRAKEPVFLLNWSKKKNEEGREGGGKKQVQKKKE